MSSVYISAGQLSVDTFFFMSGFLLAFQYFKGKIRTLEEQVISIPRNVIYRYLRLTPAMLMIYLVTITFFMNMGSGPLWTLMNQPGADVCRKYWWRFFLYIQNHFDSDNLCVSHTWYLSVEMQLFVLSLIILIPISLQLKKMGYRVVMVELLIWNIFWTCLPIITKLIFWGQSDYFGTHIRVIDYFIGMMLGLFMRMKIDQPFLYMIDEKRRHMVNLIVWHVIILGMLATFICFQDEQLHHGYVSKSVFDALMRPAWCIGLSWITYSCYHGYGGFINWILCRPIFQVLARLTYCIYLLHMAVISYFFGTIRTKSYFTEYNTFYTNCGHYVVSVILATFWTLAFESPIIVIEKYLLGVGKLSKPHMKHEEQSRVTV